MSEFYFKAPSEEETSALYKGMTFAEFAMLDDAAVDSLRQQEAGEYGHACDVYGLDDPEWRMAYNKGWDFNRFVKWRIHGIPDRDMTHEEFQERVRFDIILRRKLDPLYGTLAKEDTAHLKENERELTFLAVDFAEASGLAQPIVRLYDDVTDRLGVTSDNLVQKGVLETYEIPASTLFNRSIGYVLTGKFAAHVLVRQYPT